MRTRSVKTLGSLAMLGAAALIVSGCAAGNSAGPSAEPSDVAAMVLFLASGASSWITGQTYPVNGGFSFAQ